MKNFDETFFKLMTIYEHFSSLEIGDKYLAHKTWIVPGEKPIDYNMFPFVFVEVSSLFEDWIKIADDLIFYGPNTLLLENASIRHFLGLSEREFCHLFIPNFQCVARYGGELLELHATPEQVANNISVFLQMVIEKQKKNKRYEKF